MPNRRRLFADISWFQVAASALAAVTAAWIASSLGVAGTLIGAALGSFVVTISTALYGHTLDRGKTLIVQTTSGTIVQKAVHDGDIAEAFEEVEEVAHSPVQRAEVVEEPPARLHWKTIFITTLVVLAIALASISAYELASGRTLDGSGGTTIGDTFGGHKGKPDPTSTPTPDATTPTPTPTPSVTRTPTPAPSSSTPTPSPSTSTPTPTPSTPPE